PVGSGAPVAQRSAATPPARPAPQEQLLPASRRLSPAAATREHPGSCPEAGHEAPGAPQPSPDHRRRPALRLVRDDPLAPAAARRRAPAEAPSEPITPSQTAQSRRRRPRPRLPLATAHQQKPVAPPRAGRCRARRSAVHPTVQTDFTPCIQSLSPGDGSAASAKTLSAAKTSPPSGWRHFLYFSITYNA